MEEKSELENARDSLRHCVFLSCLLLSSLPFPRLVRLLALSSSLTSCLSVILACFFPCLVRSFFRFLTFVGEVSSGRQGRDRFDSLHRGAHSYGGSSSVHPVPLLLLRG